MTKQIFTKTSVAIAIASTCMANIAYAQENEAEVKEMEVIEVRGGQRVKTLNEVPASVSVIGGDSCNLT